ncbi:tyrosine-type recombinase/integrase, partial [Phycisphaerales bacterium AB-hyl4]
MTIPTVGDASCPGLPTASARPSAWARWPDRQIATLASFIDDYIASRTDLTPGTLQTFKTARDRLLSFFDADREMRTITGEETERYRIHLIKQGYAENSIRGYTKKARHFFRVAIKRDLLHSNPFEGLPATVTTNLERFYYVGRGEIDAVLDACPDERWRLIVALARYGGVRVPTEILPLRWQDVDWENQRMKITSPKTKHQGKGSRVIPLFPELVPHLRAAFEAAEEGSTLIFTGSLTSKTNLRTQLQRIIKRAGLEPWPKLFQNMRSTRETELAEQFPLHVVCRWIGNTEMVATKFYLQFTDEHFERAVQPAGSGDEAAQNAAQQSAAEPCTDANDAPNEKPQVPDGSD